MRCPVGVCKQTPRGGKREFVQVLQLFKVFPDGVVRAAVHDALELGAISAPSRGLPANRCRAADAVKHLALCKIERRPPRLDLTEYPHLPTSTVAATNPADYMALTTGAAS